MSLRDKIQKQIMEFGSEETVKETAAKIKAEALKELLKEVPEMFEKALGERIEQMKDHIDELVKESIARHIAGG